MKRCVVFTLMVCLSFTTASRAMPPDQPDIVYIDGSPCNRLCQSYMAWSRRLLNRSARDSADMPSQVAAPAAAKPTSAIHDRLVKPRLASTEAIRPATIAKLPPRMATSPAAANAKPADTSRTKPAETPNTGKPENPEKAQTNSLDSAHTSSSSPKQVETAGVETADAKQAAEPSSRLELGSTADSLPSSIRAQVVAAAAVAERSTPAAIESPQRKQMSENASEQANAGPKATEPDANTMVALLVARPEIKSVSELAGKDVAIDDRQSASETPVKTALAAAGAPEVQLRDGATMAIDRLLRGEVPAAVVTLVSPEAAAAFPDIAGFHVFKIPLTSH